MALVITTFPESTSANVGDQLISQSFIALAQHAGVLEKYETIFREAPLTPDVLSRFKGDAIFLPGMSVAYDSYPRHYALTEDPSDLPVGLIPFGCSWQHPIGNIEDAERASISPTFRRALLNIVDRSGPITTRDAQAEAILQRNGIPALTVGDCAWYHLPSRGKPMRRPAELRNIVVTTPHATRFKDQSTAIIDMLKESWPSARIVLSLHSKNRKISKTISDYAKSIDVDVIEAAGKPEIFDEYENFDLHVGHRLHGHIGFLRRRIPSILFMEDARSKGFAHSLPVGCFEANRSDHTNLQLAQMPIEDALPLVSADMAAVTRARHFIEQELQTRFARYTGVPKFLDTMLDDVFLPVLEDRVKSVRRALGRPAQKSFLRIFNWRTLREKPGV